MNMNKDMVNRALFAAGQEMLTAKDKDEKTPKYDMCRSCYFQTFLEALSEVPWTGGKRRKRLLKTRLPHREANYRFVYDLPYDCARPIELLEKEMFIVEGGFLFTDVEKAELLYVTNGRVLPGIAALQAPDIFNGEVPDFVFSSGFVDECDIQPDVTFYSGTPWDIPWHGPRDYVDEHGNHIVEEANTIIDTPEGWDWNYEQVSLPADPVSTDDYPEYRPPVYEPKFYEYVEKMMAAKFALAENPRAHTALLQEAMLIKNDAYNTTKSIAAAKQQPSVLWADRLGLGGANNRPRGGDYAGFERR